MDNTIIASLIGVIGGLVGAWIGGILSRKASREATEASNKNAINIINRQEFNRAAAEFRESFVEAQRFLAKHYTYEIVIDKHKPTVFEVLDKFFIRHERAVIRFRPHLTESAIPGFDAAWQKYCCYDDWDMPLKCYSQEGGKDPEVEKEFINRANTHLNIFLEYAKPLQV